MPRFPDRLVLPFALLVFLFVFLQLNVITIAFDKLGLSPHSAALLLMITLLGSMINLPVFSMKVENMNPAPLPTPWRLFGLQAPPHTDRTLVAVNAGGCVTPVAFSAYLLAHHPLSLLTVTAGVGTVTLVSYLMSQPIPGVGIGMPILVAPLTAALVAIILDPAQSAPLAYISGTMGVLIGADILHLGGIRKMAPPFASIGGAGTFDGIFMTGIVAVLLA